MNHAVRILVVFFGLILTLLSCQSRSPQQLCKEIVFVTCQKLLDCADSKAKRAAPFLENHRSCETEYLKRYGCNESNLCPPGKTYKFENVEKCLKQADAIECGDIKQGKPDPLKLWNCDRSRKICS